MEPNSRAVVTVLGNDRMGIIAGVSRVLYEHNVNILDISQSVRSGYFHMVLVADISAPDCNFEELRAALEQLGRSLKLQIRIQRSEIFDSMYQV